MDSMFWASSVSLLTVLLMIWISWRVGKARVACGVKAPATTGDPHFERHYRVQMNTLENAVPMLVALWIAALYGAAWAVAVGGLVWLVGRVLYALAYVKDPSTRGAGFNISAAGFVILFIAAAICLARVALGI